MARGILGTSPPNGFRACTKFEHHSSTWQEECQYNDGENDFPVAGTGNLVEACLLAFVCDRQSVIFRESPITSQAPGAFRSSGPSSTSFLVLGHHPRGRLSTRLLELAGDPVPREPAQPLMVGPWLRFRVQANARPARHVERRQPRFTRRVVLQFLPARRGVF